MRQKFYVCEFPVAISHSRASASFAAIMLALSAGSALAGNAPPPVMTWTGFYAGLNAGYGWDASPGVTSSGAPLQTGLDELLTSPFGFGYTYAAGSPSHAGASALSASGVAGAGADGGLGGGQFGYNHQFERFVLGLEADIQSVHARGRGSFLGAATATAVGWDSDFAFSTVEQQKAVDWLGTFRGRLGYLVTPSLLAYATGGLAYGGVDARTNIFQRWTISGANPFFGGTLQSSGATGRFSDIMVGWTLGAGFEWMFAPNLSLKGEYLYYDLGGAHWGSSPLATIHNDLLGPTAANALTVRSSTRFDGHILRAGLNYHFNPFAAPQQAGAPPAPFGWAGFYAGLNAGYGWDASPDMYTLASPAQGDLGMGGLDWASLLSSSARGVSRANAGGGSAGGQIGYNYRLDRFVAGLEADIQGARIRGRGGFLNSASTSEDFFGTTFTSVATAAVETEKTLDWFGTVRGRLGYLATPTILAYGTGGLAYGGVTAHTTIMQGWGGNFIGPQLQSSGAIGHFSDTRVGWTAGGGFEWMFAPNLSLKGEYLYYDLGDVQYASSPLAASRTVCAPCNTFTLTSAVASRARFDGHIARAGLNYHFDFGAPDPALDR